MLLQGLPGLRGEKGDDGERGEKVDAERMLRLVNTLGVMPDVNGRRREVIVEVANSVASPAEV